MLKQMLRIFFLISLFAAGHAIAQLPAPKTLGGLTYLSGGIGDGEEKAIRGQADQYSALLELSAVEASNLHGQWVADAAVTIKSGNAVLARLEGQGPLLLLRLKPAQYTIEATRHGDTKVVRFNVKSGGKLVQERFVWVEPPGTLRSLPK